MSKGWEDRDRVAKISENFGGGVSEEEWEKGGGEGEGEGREDEEDNGEKAREEREVEEVGEDEGGLSENDS